MKDIDQKKRETSFPKLKFKINFFGHFIHHYTKSLSKQLKVLKWNHSLVFPCHLVGVESCVWPGQGGMLMVSCVYWKTAVFEEKCSWGLLWLVFKSTCMSVLGLFLIDNLTSCSKGSSWRVPPPPYRSPAPTLTPSFWRAFLENVLGVEVQSSLLMEKKTFPTPGCLLLQYLHSRSQLLWWCNRYFSLLCNLLHTVIWTFIQMNTYTVEQRKNVV